MPVVAYHFEWEPAKPSGVKRSVLSVAWDDEQVNVTTNWYCPLPRKPPLPLSPLPVCRVDRPARFPPRYLAPLRARGEAAYPACAATAAAAAAAASGSPR